MVPHRAMEWLVLNNRYAKFEAGDRRRFRLRIRHLMPRTMEVWAPLLNGGCIVSLTTQPCARCLQVCKQRLTEARGQRACGLR